MSAKQELLVTCLPYVTGRSPQPEVCPGIEQPSLEDRIQHIRKEQARFAGTPHTRNVTIPGYVTFLGTDFYNKILPETPTVLLVPQSLERIAS